MDRQLALQIGLMFTWMIIAYAFMLSGKLKIALIIVTVPIIAFVIFALLWGLYLI